MSVLGGDTSGKVCNSCSKGLDEETKKASCGACLSTFYCSK